MIQKANTSLICVALIQIMSVSVTAFTTSVEKIQSRRYGTFRQHSAREDNIDADTARGASTDMLKESEYRSSLLADDSDWDRFLGSLKTETTEDVDHFWEQMKLEAMDAVEKEPEAGPQIYQCILSQRSLMEAVCSIIAHQLETELIPANQIKSIFLEMLTADDECAIRLDLQAVVTRSPSVLCALVAVMYQKGFHALVSYRVGHRLWCAGRRGLAMYMQSTVSRQFSADIHPACEMGHGIYLRTGAGVVIGETATVGNDVSILEGVTLGGTGKEAGDRHPKVGCGAIIQDGGTILGNIPVGEGSVVTAKSIVTKPVPPLAIVSGVPAVITSYRTLEPEEFDDDLQMHLMGKYLEDWREYKSVMTESAS